jgi:hypothetical protein
MYLVARSTLILLCAFIAGCSAQYPVALGASQYARLGASHSAGTYEHPSKYSSSSNLLPDQMELALEDVGQTRTLRTRSQVPQVSAAQVPAMSPKRNDPQPTTHASLFSTATDAGASVPGVLGDRRNHRRGEDVWFAQARWQAEDGWYAEHEIKAKQAISGICRAC